MLLDDLKNLDHPTSQERLIISYILKHPDEVPSMTSQSLADATLTSAATITRLCKKLGLSGFSEFREQLTVEYSISAEGLLAQLNKPLINNRVSSTDVMNLLPCYYSRVIYETSKHLVPADVARASELLGEATVVDLYGSGINYALMQQFAFQLETASKVAGAHDAANVHMIECLTSQSGHVALVASHTGKNRSMIEAAGMLAKRGIPVIGISADSSSELAKASTVHLRIFTTPTLDKLSLVTYPLSIGYVLDLLYTSLLPSRMATMFGQNSQVFYGEEADSRQ